MRGRQLITLGLVLGGGALAALALASTQAWLSSWRSIFSGAQLTSPLGCDCGVILSFWQHPFIYGLGLGSTLLSLGLTVTLAVSLLVTWRKTRVALRHFVPVPIPFDLSRHWFDLHSRVIPKWWPTWLRPQFLLIQDDQPRGMSSGFFHPTVFCSTGAVQQLSEAELRAMLVHELMHIRSADQVLLWLVRSWTGLLPSRLKEAVCIRLVEYIECHTDQEAASVVGSSAIGSALLSVVTWQPSKMLPATAQFEGVVETRLHVLAGWLQTPSLPWKPLVVFSLWVMSILITVGVLFTKIQTVFAQELRSPACLAAESVMVVNHAIVLYCPKTGMFEWSTLPMSPLE